MKRVNRIKTWAARAAIFAVLLPGLANAKDVYEAKYPPYVKSADQQIEFSVQCVVAYQFAKKEAVNESNEIRANNRLNLWEDNLESLVTKKKRRKKLIKVERKAYASKPKDPMAYLNVMGNMKKQMQCDHPTEDLRKIG